MFKKFVFTIVLVSLVVGCQMTDKKITVDGSESGILVSGYVNLENEKRGEDPEKQKE